MYFPARSSSRSQQLGFWGELIGAAVTLGSKAVDRSIAKKNAAIEQQRIALDEKRNQLELIKLQNQQKIAEMQIQREMQLTPVERITGNIGQALSKPVTLPGVGSMPLSYILIPAAVLGAVLLLKRK